MLIKNRKVVFLLFCLADWGVIVDFATRGLREITDTTCRRRFCKRGTSWFRKRNKRGPRSNRSRAEIVAKGPCLLLEHAGQLVALARARMKNRP